MFPDSKILKLQHVVSLSVHVWLDLDLLRISSVLAESIITADNFVLLLVAAAEATILAKIIVDTACIKQK